MEFHRVVGKIDGKLVHEAEKKLSAIFIELAMKYTNEHGGSNYGGDALIFNLVYPVKHICTMNIPTAATDGKHYYWNPKFVMKQSRLGLRFICAHEAWHAIYMHPQRRGSRLPRLWNIAVDYIVNGTVMEDIKNRRKDPTQLFKEHLGNFKTLPEYMEMLKDPFKMKGDDKLTEEDIAAASGSSSDVKLPAPGDDRELTTAEIEELEKREKKPKFFFADPDLSDDMKRPEAIYDALYALLPKCPDCGSVGIYQKPKKSKKDKNDQGQEDGGKSPGGKKESKDGSGKGDKGKGKKGKGQPGGEPGEGQGEKSDSHEHSQDGSPCDCGEEHGEGEQDGNGEGEGAGEPSQNPGQGCGHGCGTCGDGIDVFDLGGTVDDHFDAEETQEKMAKRVSEAMEAARKMAGYIPAALEEELGKLTAPKVTWQDILRGMILRARSGGSKNDYNSFKTRPMFAGVMTPKRKTYMAKFGCLLDTSGSMSQEDIAFGLSQLAGLDDKGEGVVTCADCEIYFEESTPIKKANIEELSKVKIVGRGGTYLSTYFDEYEQHIGKCDFLVVITDGYLTDHEISTMKDPGVPVLWLITSNSGFVPPIGKKYDLRDM